MKTFSQMRTAFLDSFIQLSHLDKPARVTQALRIVKERDTGKLCYQAEEDLPQAELFLLKDMLHVEESRWETYKQTYRESLSSWIRR